MIPMNHTWYTACVLEYNVYDRDLIRSKDKPPIHYVLANRQFIADNSKVKVILYLCEYVKCITQ